MRRSRPGVLALLAAGVAHLRGALAVAQAARPAERDDELAAYTARRRAIARAVGDMERERARLDRL